MIYSNNTRLFFVLFLLLSFFTVVSSKTTSRSNNKISQSSLSPISIDGNADLALQSFVGNGSQSFPYVLSNFNIYCPNVNEDFGVEIKNTDKYIIVSNITVQHCYYGFYIENVSFITFHINYAINNYDGFMWINSHSYTFINNIAINNSGSGFRGFNNFNHKVNNNLKNNLAIGNGNSGFYLYASDNNNLVDNQALNNGNTGFYFQGSFHNYLKNNIVTNSHSNGFSIEYGGNITLINNYSENCSYAGFYFGHSSNNSFINNYATQNLYGFYSDYSSQISLTNNSAISNYYGIYVSNSEILSLINNTAQLNNKTNYDEYNSNGISFLNNTFIDIEEYTIPEAPETNSTLTHSIQNSNLLSNWNIFLLSSIFSFSLILIIAYLIKNSLLRKDLEHRSSTVKKVKFLDSISRKFKIRSNENQLSQQTLDILEEIIEDTKKDL